jgi:Mg-chelatase subunit ChlD
VDYRPPVYGPPQVTVLGYERKRASVVFILDCSHSMQTLATVEAPGAQSRTQASRMEVAKGALRALLGDMAEQGTVRVGVRLFGHRVGWSTTEADKLLRQTSYGDDIPAALRPYADVENVLPLGRFDSLAAGRVFDKLQTVKPWGESPLYLALQQAVGDFGPDDNAARSIVVVTDGQNYQFNPPREFQPALADVLSAAERARVAIHIVGFDLPQNEAQAAGREFTEIASRTGGSYAPASSVTALLNSLQRLLRPGEFQVTSGGSPVGEAELGQPVVLRGQRGRQRYDVQFENRREAVELAGGEAVELAIRRGEPRLEVLPYLKGNPRFEPLVTSGDNAQTPLQAGIHRSIRTPEGVQFPISLQHSEGHFVPRPAELWVEVAPVGLPPESSPGPYIFYDAPFAPETTVPLVTLLARNWPPEAAKAEIRVWAKNVATPPTEERPLAEIADRLPDGGGGFSIPGVSGVTYQVRTAGGNGEALAIGLIERHERPESVGSLKVTLAPVATRATHQFDRQNRIVLHTFHYEQAAGDLRGRLSVQFTLRSSALQHSWQTSQPTIIDVADRSDLLELSPPTAR